MKRILVLLMVAVLMLAAMGSLAEEKKELRFAWINPLIGHPVYTIQDEGVLMGGEDYGVQVDILGTPQVNPMDYATQIEIAVTEGYDGIIIAPYSPGSMIGAIDAAIAAGIPVVNTIMDTSEPQRICMLGLNNAYMGELQADAIAEALGGKGQVAFAQTNFEIATQNEIREGFLAHLAKNYPDIEVVVSEQITADTMTATDKFQNMFTAYPDLVGVVIVDGSGGTSAAKVAQEMGREMKVVCIDDIPETLDLIGKGEIYATIAQNLKGMAYEAVRILYEYNNGMEIPNWVEVPMYIVTQENLDTYFEEMFALTHLKGEDW